MFFYILFFLLEGHFHQIIILVTLRLVFSDDIARSPVFYCLFNKSHLESAKWQTLHLTFSRILKDKQWEIKLGGASIDNLYDKVPCTAPVFIPQETGRTVGSLMCRHSCDNATQSIQYSR